jgi:hypothetical protein
MRQDADANAIEAHNPNDEGPAMMIISCQSSFVAAATGNEDLARRLHVRIGADFRKVLPETSITKY